jgi:predicted DNA-binding transcriptional regulator AlpA
MDATTVNRLRRPKKAAVELDIGVSTLWHWIKTRPGFPAPIKAGPGVTLIDMAATENYLRAQSEVAP